MQIIGLTGPSGAGKGTVASLFAGFGVPSVDTDAVYHELLIPPSPCLCELAAHFGRSILTDEGTLNRPALSALVFAPGQEEELRALNRITHRHILAETRRLTEYRTAGVAAVLVDAPQLFESGFDAECDRILSVLAPYEVRLSRIMARDGLNRAQAEARLKVAHSDAFFREHSDAVLVNDREISVLAGEVHRLLTEWGVLS